MSDLPPTDVVVYSAKALHRIAWTEHRFATCMCLLQLAACCVVLPFDWIVWFLLGILSTIGLGTGVATGLLFLWPMVVTEAMQQDPFFDTWTRVLPACMAHALGSTVGELPPYLAAQSLVTQLNLENQPLYTWTVDYVQRWGAPMILAFAVWPNSVFDMCGIASGAANVPIYTFLTMTMTGKGLIRAPMTAAILILANQSAYDILPDWMDAFLHSMLSKKEKGVSSMVWTCGVAALTLAMAWKTMKDVAQSERLRLVQR